MHNHGVVKEILFPNKAILTFKLAGQEEKAILLAKNLTLDGHTWEDIPSQPQILSDVLKTGDELEFDCHIYDKGGGLGSGKDKCNYFAMKAWRTTQDGASGGTATPTAQPVPLNPHLITGTGWISELTPRKGVLTFERVQGGDERVLFLASKVYFFEKRLGAKQSLFDLCTEGDNLQFEAVPSENVDTSTLFCAWFATLVWKGRKPAPSTPSVDVGKPGGLIPGHQPRRSSLGSSEHSIELTTPVPSDEAVHLDFVNGRVSDTLIKGVGQIAKIINDKSGVIWWLKNGSCIQSVWFEAKQTFLYGSNLADKSLQQVFKADDPVLILAELAPSNFPTKWLAKQVIVNDYSTSIVDRIMKSFSPVDASTNQPDESMDH
eukprot:TCALIF_03545-PA protein Name:"Protein of unknown function" AED:0.28 eAED:0.28 QI:0/0.5/0.33/1/1/1/3/1431/375